MLHLYVAVQAAALSSAPRARGDRGQATAEYALVLLGAATIALLLLAWATKSGRVGKLFESVFDAITDKL